MTRYAGATTEILLRRVRETGDIGVGFDFALDLLSICQRVANAGLQSVKSSGTLTTAIQTLAYHYRTQLTDAVDVISVYDGTRTLSRFDSLAELTAYDPDWWRKVDGTRHDFWCQVGRDLLIIYPGMATADSLTVVYSKLTTVLDDHGDALELPDEEVDIPLGLAETFLLLMTRDHDAIDKRLAALGEDVLLSRGMGGA